mmetsp:Transcript_14315/g.23843  ORF Transcript_14315/g.23843 Transcript_14315/m.23843 type:complete len:174 (-) Transcript_14315:515-1036(-)
MVLRVAARDLIKTFKIWPNDTVKVLAGKDRGKRGKVKQIMTDSNRVIVEGINLATREFRVPGKPWEKAKIQKESPIHYSNVQLIDPRTKQPCKTVYQYVAEERRMMRLHKTERYEIPRMRTPRKLPEDPSKPRPPREMPDNVTLLEDAAQVTFNPEDEVVYSPDKPRVLPLKI